MAAVVGYSRGRTGRGAQGHGSGGCPWRRGAPRDARTECGPRDAAPVRYTTLPSVYKTALH